MAVLYILVVLLALIVLFLSLALYLFAKKSLWISEKEKEFIVFVIDIFEEYGDDLGVQSIEQHKKLVEELEKIKKKHFNIKPNEQTK
jgi:sensor histidine kinase YesM